MNLTLATYANVKIDRRHSLSRQNVETLIWKQRRSHPLQKKIGGRAANNRPTWPKAFNVQRSLMERGDGGWTITVPISTTRPKTGFPAI